jgi:hypothetical protein
MRFTERIRQAWDDLSQSRFEKHLMRELAVAQGKVERMELSLMPMTLPGAAYVRSAKPVPAGFGKKDLDTAIRSGSWASIVADHEKELAEEEKSHGDGVRTKSSTAETPAAKYSTGDVAIEPSI